MKKKVINYIMGLTTIGLAGYLILQKFKLAGRYYLEFQEIFLFVVYFEFIELIIIFLSFISFFILFWENPIHTRMYKHFQKLSFKNKIFFAWFTIIYAIPNKILINNRLSSFTTSFIIFLILVISYIFPIFSLFYLIFWITVLESYFFAILYKEKEYFKKFIDGKLFVNNLAFGKDYFSFFWGNMDKGGAGKGRAGFIGTLFGGLYKLARDHEKARLREQTKQEMTQHIANAKQKPQTAQESLQLQKDVEDHIIDRDLPILSTEKKLKNAAQAFGDYMNG